MQGAGESLFQEQAPELRSEGMECASQHSKNHALVIVGSNKTSTHIGPGPSKR